MTKPVTTFDDVAGTIAFTLVSGDEMIVPVEAIQSLDLERIGSGNTLRFCSCAGSVEVSIELDDVAAVYRRVASCLEQAILAADDIESAPFN